MPAPVAELNSLDYERPAAISPDGLTLYISTNQAGGAGGYDLMAATRPTLSSPFNAPTGLARVNTANDEFGGSMSGDGLTLYYILADAVDANIWSATRASVLDQFGSPAPIAELNSASFDNGPAISHDGLEIYFVSMRGGADPEIYVATRASVALPFDAPQLATSLNSTSNEWEVSLSADDLTVIVSSDRPGSVGGSDLWMATRPDRVSAFGTLTDLAPVNSTSHEVCPVQSFDGRELYFASDRSGNRDIWVSRMSCVP